MRVLVAEDDPALRSVVTRGLEEAGYVVDAAEDGGAALAFLSTYEYAAVVIDWRMPVRSGLEVIEAMRRRGDQTAVLMLTARDTPADRVAGLDAGADDYLVKPFDFGELLARLRALRRRSATPLHSRLEVGGLVIDSGSRSVTTDGVPLPLTATEFRILELLAERSPNVVSRSSIALSAWPNEADAVGSNTIEVHVGHLRGKLAGTGAAIETVRGAGYRLVCEERP